MSRSRKHTPVHGTCTYKPGEMKWWRTRVNRVLRRKAKADPEDAPTSKNVVDRWSAPDDGKGWDPYPEWERK
jgi:hypothetical protein